MSEVRLLLSPMRYYFALMKINATQRFFLVLLCLHWFRTPLLVGQQRQDPFHVEAGSVVRIQQPGSQRHQGTLLRATTDSLVIAGAESPFSLALTSLDSIWVRRTYVKTGILSGILLGGVAGAFAGAFLVRANCDNGVSCSDDYLTAIPLGAIFLAGAGGIFGAIIGGASHRWVLLYPANRAP